MFGFRQDKRSFGLQQGVGMSTLTVGSGSGFNFYTLSSAIAASQDGDVIQVQAGTYTNDFATINTRITIEGVGGMVHLVATEPPPDRKAILTINTDATLDNIEFSGASISNADGGNAAGIRYQGGNLVLDHCYFHDNQEGLLAGPNPTGTITINDTEFADNGNPDPPSGIEHNIYVGAIQQLTITNSYVHGAIFGHEIKSRAANTTIEDSRIENGPTGTGNYAIDLPNGGKALIKNNVIEKGPKSVNHTFISYGEEGNVHANSALSVTGNTVLNDSGSAAVTFVSNQTSVAVSVTANTLYGVTAGELVNGPVALPENNTLLPQASEPALDTSDPFLPVIPFTFGCYVTGTRILTDDGEMAVETLRVGQQVVAVQLGDASKPRQCSGENTECASTTTLHRIGWIGHRYIDLGRHRDPRLAQPIRIRRNAFADNVPRRDLLVSPDHALYLDGLLIPARLLRNDATIVRDAHLGSVRYFHLELDRHAILLAEGLPAESYLDTGNRGSFDNAGTPLLLHPDLAVGGGQQRREALSCAPFAADAARVERIWHRLANRAEQLGYQLAKPATTKDPALRISVEGREILPVDVAHRHYSFILPRSAGARSNQMIRLVSRATAPCEVTPWCEDQRRLGVAVGRIVVTDTTGPVVLPVDHPSLTGGWAAAERLGSTLWRWTLGHAELILPLDAMVLEIHLAAVTTYRLEMAEPVPLQCSAAA